MDETFAGYRFHRVLRDGAFEATETETGDAVVIESPVASGDDDADLREWFTEAWEALREVEHAGLPVVRSLGENDGMPFAVREPIDGVPLPRLLEESPVPDAAAARVLSCRLADAIEHAHEEGVIHGGLDPADVIVEGTDEGDPAPHVVGWGRVEGRRGDDVRALGEIIEALLVAEREAHEAAGPADEDGGEGEDGERTPIEEAILAMLAGVATDARDGTIRTAAEVRDAIAAGSADGKSRGRGLRVLGGLALAAVVVVIVVVVAGGGDSGDEIGTTPAVPPTTTTTSAPETTTATTEPTEPEDDLTAGAINAPGGPRGIAIRDGVIYVATDSGELLRFDEATGEDAEAPVDLAGAADELTVVDGVPFVTLPEEGELVSLAVGSTEPDRVSVGEDPGALAAALGSIFVLNEGSADVSRVDPAAGTSEPISIDLSEPSGIAYGFGSLWISDRAGPLQRLDPSDPASSESFDMGEDAAAVLVTDDRVWVANEAAGTVTGLYPETGETETIDVGGTPVDLAADPEGLWVANDAGYVTFVDAASGELSEVEIPKELGKPVSVAVGEGVWTATDGDEVVPVEPGG